MTTIAEKWFNDGFELGIKLCNEKRIEKSINKEF